MASTGTKALLAIGALIAVVFVIAIVVGVLYVAIANVNNSLVTAVGCQASNSLASNYCANNQAVKNFGTVVGVAQIVIPFISVVAIIAAAKIILDVFGFGNLFKMGTEKNQQ